MARPESRFAQFLNGYATNVEWQMTNDKYQMKWFCLYLVSCFLFLSPVFATEEAMFVPDFQIKLINSKNGDITIVKNGISEVVGHVILPTQKFNPKGFTASQWAGTSEVAATSVNAIHVKVKNSKTIFSILPVEFLEHVSNYNSYFSPNSSVYTSIHAGSSIFGGGFSPYVGNIALINNAAASSELKDGDEIVINADKIKNQPKSIIFENKLNGMIMLIDQDGNENIIGVVLKPVVGVGRFEGSRFLYPGRIRANHPGVIDVSTAVGGRVGGFQIIPAAHAQSPEMVFARTKTQWMVVSGTSVESNTREGMPPLFKYFIKPQYDPNDLIASNWQEKLLKRFLVDVKIKGREGWQSMPVYGQNPDEDLPDEAVTFMKNVEKIRILFPQISEPATERRG